ncbi:hypothetical protein [Micromonospora sp. WMMD998]|uniref:DUF6197 family protein n=1 Tax=Micromonospora sp. WMMD998 TaxID=3016092 RepID=UPI00249C3741|nr:hypothetical protein [Micromonospora sp. WMMD998]WFE37981.1 hypothetical protein O7619_05860 [Micromonospora sp. WMMD998]
MKATHNQTTGVQVTPADLLRMAALYLRRNGWAQGTYYTPDPTGTGQPFRAACSVGAIGMAAAGRRMNHPDQLHPADAVTYRRAIAAFVDYLDNFAPVFHIDEDGYLLDEHTSPYSWNDDPARTAEQVITALEAAADEWDRLHTDGGENR